MCGICGIAVDSEPPEPEEIWSMMRRLVHRGPDSAGWYRDERVALGHTRLAILDPANGDQPMSADGRVWVVFNGEIYNFVELRRELAGLGHQFRTRCDTEVVVHAYLAWGSGCFERFNGQWAIAVWDATLGRLVLARDRVGICPLYYAPRRGRLAFASSIAALFQDTAVSREFDPAAIGQVFSLWSAMAPRTLFSSVRQLPPGHLLEWTSGGPLRISAYWQPSFPSAREEPRQSFEGAVGELRELLVESVRHRFLRSDVPVAGYLSGGIDSSVILSLMRRFTDAPMATFSLRFTDSEFDEGPYQDDMLARLGEVSHHQVEVSAADAAQIFPAVVSAAETILVRTAPAPMYLLAQLVRARGYKVVVTGEGADEVFGGYDLFREVAVRRFWARKPESTRRTDVVKALYPWLSRSPGQAPAFARDFFGLRSEDDQASSHRPRWSSTAALRTLLRSDLRAEVDTVTAEPALPIGSVDWDPLARAQWLELTTLLPGYLLASQGDRMLMAHSIEGRYPYLDPEVVEFGASLAARHKLFGLEEKWILRQAFADLIPASITGRPKQPYRAPDASVLMAADWLDDVTSPDAVTAAGLFEPRVVQGLIMKARARGAAGLGNTDSMRLTAVASGQLLYSALAAAPNQTPRQLPTIAVAVDHLRRDPQNARPTVRP